MMIATQIKPIQAADLAVIASIEQQSQLSPWPLSGFQSCLDLSYCSGWMLTNALPLDGAAASVVVAAELTHIPLAYLFVRHILDEAEVLNLVVAPRWRRLGFGRSLVAPPFFRSVALVGMLGRRYL